MHQRHSFIFLNIYIYSDFPYGDQVNKYILISNIINQKDLNVPCNI